MTVTEVPGDTHVAATESDQGPQGGGLAALVGTGDPRTIGKLFVGTSLLFALAVGVIGLLAAIDRIDPSSYDILGSGAFAQVLTAHQLGALLLVVLPLLLGLAHAVVPLQVGSSTVAFPRGSSVAFWGYVVSGLLLVSAYVADGGPFGGDRDAVGLYVLALVALIASLLTATISVVATVLAMRSPGMTLRRIPTFSWSMLVAGTLWLLTLPVLAGLLALFYVDVTHGGNSLFAASQEDPFGAGQLWDQIRWVFWQPAVYAFAIPVLGIVGDIVPVFARSAPRRHAAVLVLIGLFGALSFGAWTTLPLPLTDGGQHVLAPDALDWLYNEAWVGMSIVVVLPLLGLLGLWGLALKGGRPRLGAPLLLALGAGTLLLVGLGAGVATAIEDAELFGTTWVTGQAYAVLTAALVAAVAGLFFWAPKLYGKVIVDGVGKLLAPLLVLGGLLVAVGYAVGGVLHQPWLLGTGIDQGNAVDQESTIEAFNTVAAVGLAVLLAAGALLILALVRLLATAPGGVGDDPWGGRTLEWTVSSPPPVGNFAELPTVRSATPLYDQQADDNEGQGAVTDGRPAQKEVSA